MIPVSGILFVIADIFTFSGNLINKAGKLSEDYSGNPQISEGTALVMVLLKKELLMKVLILHHFINYP